MKLKKLKNRYFYLRHGRAENNLKGIFASDPATAVEGIGLIPELTHQITQNVEKAKSDGVLDENTVIVSSDFLRTRQTAELAREALGAGEVTHTPLIRERFFGEFDGKADDHETWEKCIKPYDEKFSQKNPHGIETVYDVLERTMQCVWEAEEKHEGKNILLVSHGDPIQILRAGFHGIAPHRHQTLPRVYNAEIAELKVQY